MNAKFMSALFENPYALRLAKTWMSVLGVCLTRGKPVRRSNTLPMVISWLPQMISVRVLCILHFCPLTLYIQMNCPRQMDTIRMGLSITYLNGWQARTSRF